MAMNKLNWNTTQVNEDRYLYLHIMRDMKSYCARGYCEVEIALNHFVDMSSSLIKRLLPLCPAACHVEHMTVDWNDYHSTHRFMQIMTATLCELNNVRFNARAFSQAFDEFSQYMRQAKPK